MFYSRAAVIIIFLTSSEDFAREHYRQILDYYHMIIVVLYECENYWEC